MSANGNGDQTHVACDPKVGWKDRVTYADEWRGRFAYRPHDVVTSRGQEALDVAWALWPDQRESIGVDGEVGPCARLANIPDPLWLIEELRMRGIPAQPNHVLFIHCDCCGPHPAGGGFAVNPASINPASINPASINPASINPASINPASINPASINPASINPNHPARVTGMRRSSARPAVPTADEVTALTKKICAKSVKNAPKVIVLDTGLAVKKWQPMLTHAPAIKAASTGQIQLFGTAAEAGDEPDNDVNEFLDPAAGHGTFIAGIINQVAPGCQVTVHRVASIFGDTDEFTAAAVIDGLQGVDDHTILSLSFGGHTMDDEALALAWAIRGFRNKGGVVVASAGNDSTCVPAFPAALPGVVSVGAVGPGGPASFTNYGPWVRACAPGVGLTSTFFDGFVGKMAIGPDGLDPDDFKGWATWSGTSFSAPVVVGALARMMMWAAPCTAAKAVERVIDAPELMRIPNLGTVVNVI